MRTRSSAPVKPILRKKPRPNVGDMVEYDQLSYKVVEIQGNNALLERYTGRYQEQVVVDLRDRKLRPTGIRLSSVHGTLDLFYDTVLVLDRLLTDLTTEFESAEQAGQSSQADILYSVLENLHAAYDVVESAWREYERAPSA